MILTQISFLVVKHSHHPLFIPLPGTERVLEDGVHDSADAKGRLDYIGNNLLHCGKIETVVFPHEQLTVLLYSSSEAASVSPLTVQSFLEPLHTDHVFGQFKCPVRCLKAELPADVNTTTSPNQLGIEKRTNTFINKPNGRFFSQKLPIFIEKLLLISDVAFVADSQVLQNQLGIFLVGRAYGCLIGLKLDNIHYFV